MKCAVANLRLMEMSIVHSGIFLCHYSFILESAIGYGPCSFSQRLPRTTQMRDMVS